MGILHKARLSARRLGLDITRYPEPYDPMRLAVRLMEARDVNVVMDIGANSGRYASEIRDAGYQGRIISFEPLSEPYRILEASAKADPLWATHKCAIGDSNGTATLNVAANAGESSSILPMLDAHLNAYPAAGYVGVEEAPIYTLDHLAPDLLEPGDRVFFKADVQGYERSVLAGAEATLKQHGVGMQLEMSLVPLYADGMLYREALDFADSLGMALMGVIPGFSDLRDGRMLQIDGIFFVEAPGAAPSP